MGIRNLFESIVSASLMSSVLVLLILLVKAILKEKLNHYFHYYIWILVILRLMLPYSFESSFSIYNVVNPIVSSPTIVNNQNNTSGFSNVITPPSQEINSQNNFQGEDNKGTSNVTKLEQNKYDWITILSMIWILGFSFMLSLIILGTLRVKHIIKNSLDYPNDMFVMILEECTKTMSINKKIRLIYTSKLSSPSLYSISNPTIIIPVSVAQNISTDEFKYMILHELSHLKRKDIIINWIITLLQCVYWFNPMVLYGLYKMKQDCEVACDHHAISYLNSSENIGYGNTLINIIKISNRNPWLPGATSFSTNKNELSRRIYMIAKNKKTTIGGIVVGSILIIFIGLIGLTNGKGLQNNLVDKTLKSEAYTVSQSKVSQQIEATTRLTGTYQGIDDMYSDSDYIVSGTVKDIEYFEVQHVLIRRINVLVNKNYKGTIAKNTLISILEKDSYIRLKSLYDELKKIYEEKNGDKEKEADFLYGATYMSDIKDIENDMLIKLYYINKEDSKIGDKLLLFLTDSSEDTYKDKKVKLREGKLSYPEGAYVPLGLGMGKFTLIDDNYERYNLYYTPEGTIPEGAMFKIQQIRKSYTVKEMDHELKKLK